MKKKLVSLIASLSLALGLSTSAISKDYEQERVEQYRQFYKEYHNKNYEIKKVGERIETVDGEFKAYDLLEITYGKNIYDNLRTRFSKDYDFYLNKIDKKFFNYEGPDSSWYFLPYDPEDPMRVSRKVVPLKGLDEKSLPQVMKDILTLPEDIQKQISGIMHYSIDGDCRIMLPFDKEGKLVREVYDYLNKTDKKRDAEQKNTGGMIQPVIPTDNQMLPLDLFFPPVVYIDENKDGKADYVVELYSIDDSWFDPNAEVKRINLLKWFELRQDCKEDERLRMHDKPFKIMIDFDYGQEGFDIEFFDENHDGFFERYEIIRKK